MNDLFDGCKDSGTIAKNAAVNGAIGAAGTFIGEKLAAGITSSSTTPGFDDWLNKGDSNYKLYHGMQGNAPKYTGITKQTTNVRLYQHNRAGKGFNELRVVENNLTRNQARALEQYFIESGPNELNKINSISPHNKYYNDALNWAKDFLTKRR